MDRRSLFICLLLSFLVFISLLCSINSIDTRNQLVNLTTRSDKEFYNWKKTIANLLKKINKPAVKTIQSSDGDIIDCVLTHQQPAFDHPLLKGQKPLDPPEIPRENNYMNNWSENFQLWSLSGESCPDGTIPIRRITEQNILRAGSLERFGTKSTNDNPIAHQHAVLEAFERKFYGAQATLNVWIPRLESSNTFSLSQIWLVAGPHHKELNTIEVGWQAYPEMYGNNRTRFFIYWTADSYQNTGCYNLQCPGFVQTNKDIVLGATISPTSTYKGKQFEIRLAVWKDKKTHNWWLHYGNKDIGYWPSSLFTHLKDKASVVHWGGEIVNRHYPHASSTQMGSGHFPYEGYQKASYFRNIYVLDSSYQWIMPRNVKTVAHSPNCYDIKGGVHINWGTYFYYGGPGKNNNCL